MSDELEGQGSAEDAVVAVDGDAPTEPEDTGRRIAAIEARIEKLRGHVEVAEAALAEARADDGGQ